MLLVQCKCGGFFTVRELPINRMGREIRQLHCQTCGTEFDILSDKMNYESVMRKCEEQGLKITQIPDNATVTVKFDL